MIKKTLKIFGQFITVILLLCFAIPWIIQTIPGHQSFADNARMFRFIFMVIFIVIAIGFLINSIIYYRKKQWTTYRVVAIIFILLLGLSIVSTRSVVTKILYGKVLYTITNEDDAYTVVTIRLFENKRFISETHAVGGYSENYGTYDITDKELNFKFKRLDFNHLETRYRLSNDILYCNNGKSEIKLILNKNYAYQ